MSDMAYEVTLQTPFGDSLERVIAALKEEGFGVLTRIDVHDAFKEKLGVDFRPYCILGACNPPLAHRAVSAEPSIGALLPCNVVLRAEGDRVIVDFMDPQSVLTLVEAEGINEVAAEVRSRLEKVKDMLAG